MSPTISDLVRRNASELQQKDALAEIRNFFPLNRDFPFIRAAKELKLRREAAGGHHVEPGW